jgi:hypothetical protein
MKLLPIGAESWTQELADRISQYVIDYAAKTPKKAMDISVWRVGVAILASVARYHPRGHHGSLGEARRVRCTAFREGQDRCVMSAKPSRLP